MRKCRVDLHFFRNPPSVPKALRGAGPCEATQLFSNEHLEDRDAFLGLLTEIHLRWGIEQSRPREAVRHGRDVTAPGLNTTL